MTSEAAHAHRRQVVRRGRVIDPALRTMLDEVHVSKIAEYLGQRLELEQGEAMLQLEFKQGRYQRLQRLVRAPARNVADQ